MSGRVGIDTLGQVATIDRTASRRRWVLPVVAVGFGAVLAYPYVGLDEAKSRIDVHGLHYAVLVVHVLSAAVALVVGPWQFSPRVRSLRRVHRTLGRTYLVAGVLPAGITAIPVALWSGRLLTQLSLTTAAVLWLVTGALAYRAARRRDFAGHRAWMMRNYALTFLAVTSRIVVPLLLLAGFALGSVDRATAADHARTLIPIGQTLGWIVDLLVAERLIRGRRGGRASRRAATAVAPTPASGGADGSRAGGDRHR